MRCHYCGHSLQTVVRHCPRCERLQPDAVRTGDSVDYGVLTSISIGQHLLARRFGTFFLLASGVFVAIALFRIVRYGNEDLDTFGAFMMAGALGYFAYEVWAFTHGRPTSIDRYRHEATPDRTGWRVFGLLLDLAVWYMCVHAIKSW